MTRLTPEREQEIRKAYIEAAENGIAWPGTEGAQEDVRDLVAEVDALRAEVERLTAELKALRDGTDAAADARAAITLAREIAALGKSGIPSERVILARGVLALQTYGERLRFLLETAAVNPDADAQNRAVVDWLSATTDCGSPL